MDIDRYKESSLSCSSWSEGRIYLTLDITLKSSSDDLFNFILKTKVNLSKFSSVYQLGKTNAVQPLSGDLTKYDFLLSRET